MSDLAKFLLKAYLRKGLTILGTYLITHGILTTGTAEDFASMYVEAAVGLVLIGISAAWTWLYQWYVKRKVVTALALPKGSTPTELAEALGENPA